MAHVNFCPGFLWADVNWTKPVKPTWIHPLHLGEWVPPSGKNKLYRESSLKRLLPDCPVHQDIRSDLQLGSSCPDIGLQQHLALER